MRIDLLHAEIGSGNPTFILFEEIVLQQLFDQTFASMNSKQINSITKEQKRESKFS